jgi:hypothetical protein
MYIHIYIHTYIRTYVRTYAHAHTHTHTHTHTEGDSCEDEGTLRVAAYCCRSIKKHTLEAVFRFGTNTVGKIK